MQRNVLLTITTIAPTWTIDAMHDGSMLLYCLFQIVTSTIQMLQQKPRLIRPDLFLVFCCPVLVSQCELYQKGVSALCSLFAALVYLLQVLMCFAVFSDFFFPDIGCNEGFIWVAFLWGPSSLAILLLPLASVRHFIHRGDIQIISFLPWTYLCKPYRDGCMWKSL